MARIKNIELPKDKNIQTGLTRIYGIGRSLAKTMKLLMLMYLKKLVI